MPLEGTLVRGDKTFIKQLCLLIEYWNKYRVPVTIMLGGANEYTAALDLLGSICDTLKSFNPPGPA